MDTFQALHGRQGVLHFHPDPVPPEMIRRVLKAAITAPSPANTQPWEFIVVDDPELTRATAQTLVQTQEEFVFRHMLDTPEAFTQDLMGLYADFEQVPCFIWICRHQRVDLAPPALTSLIRAWDLCALGAAMGNLMTAATALGLGTRWFGNPMLNPDPFRTLLQVPEKVELIAVTPLGYHDEPPKVRPVQSREALTGFQRGDKYKLAALLQGKLPLDEILHRNRYGTS
jgi:nitroreductase